MSGFKSNQEAVQNNIGIKKTKNLCRIVMKI